MREKRKTLLYSLIVMLLWGALYPLVKLGYEVFGIESVGQTLSFAGFRFLICGALITVFAIVRNPKHLQTLKGSWVSVLLSGAFAIVLHYSFSYLGLRMTDGSKTAILKQLGAVFYIFCSPLFFPGDRLTWQKFLGLILGICGIFAINTDLSGLTFHLGDVLIILSSFCSMFANVMNKKVFVRTEPIVAVGVSQLFGGILLLVAGLGSGGDLGALLPREPQQWMVLLAIFAASVVSYCLWVLAVKQENLSKLFIIKFSEPLFAAVVSWLLLGEDIFSIHYGIAFLLICGGIVVANRKKTTQEPGSGKG